MTVVEASGGSTGSSLAFVCAVKDYAFKIVSSNAFATEKLKTMSAFGVELDLEIVQQLPNGVDAFCGAVGVAGMVMGVAKVLRQVNSNTKIYMLEPESSPMISKGWAAEHHDEGIGIGFVSPLLDAELYDEAWGVCEQEGRKMSRLLAEQEGILAGASTGLNVVAAIELVRTLGPGKIVVTVASDTGLKTWLAVFSTRIQSNKRMTHIEIFAV